MTLATSSGWLAVLTAWVLDLVRLVPWPARLAGLGALWLAVSQRVLCWRISRLQARTAALVAAVLKDPASLGGAELATGLAWPDEPALTLARHVALRRLTPAEAQQRYRDVARTRLKWLAFLAYGAPVVSAAITSLKMSVALPLLAGGDESHLADGMAAMSELFRGSGSWIVLGLMAGFARAWLESVTEPLDARLEGLLAVARGVDHGGDRRRTEEDSHARF